MTNKQLQQQEVQSASSGNEKSLGNSEEPEELEDENLEEEEAEEVASAPETPVDADVIASLSKSEGEADDIDDDDKLDEDGAKPEDEEAAEEKEEDDCAHDEGKECNNCDEENEDKDMDEEEPEDCAGEHDVKEECSNCDEKENDQEEASEDEEDPINDRVSKKSDISRARNVTPSKYMTSSKRDIFQGGSKTKSHIGLKAKKGSITGSKQNPYSKTLLNEDLQPVTQSQFGSKKKTSQYSLESQHQKQNSIGTFSKQLQSKTRTKELHPHKYNPKMTDGHYDTSLQINESNLFDSRQDRNFNKNTTLKTELLVQDKSMHQSLNNSINHTQTQTYQPNVVESVIIESIPSPQNQLENIGQIILNTASFQAIQTKEQSVMVSANESKNFQDFMRSQKDFGGKAEGFSPNRKNDKSNQKNKKPHVTEYMYKFDASSPLKIGTIGTQKMAPNKNPSPKKLQIKCNLSPENIIQNLKQPKTQQSQLQSKEIISQAFFDIDHFQETQKLNEASFVHHPFAHNSTINTINHPQSGHYQRKLLNDKSQDEQHNASKLSHSEFNRESSPDQSPFLLVTKSKLRRPEPFKKRKVSVVARQRATPRIVEQRQSKGFAFQEGLNIGNSHQTSEQTIPNQVNTINTAENSVKQFMETNAKTQSYNKQQSLNFVENLLQPTTMKPVQTQNTNTQAHSFQQSELQKQHNQNTHQQQSQKQWQKEVISKEQLSRHGSGVAEQKTSLDQGTGIGIDSSIVLKNQDLRDNTTTDSDAILALGLFDTPQQQLESIQYQYKVRQPIKKVSKGTSVRHASQTINGRSPTGAPRMDPDASTYTSIIDLPTLGHVKKPSLGKAPEINNKYNNKGLFRRIILQKQSELMRKHHKRGGVVKSINDVLRVATIEEKQNRREELLQSYLSNKHSFWVDPTKPKHSQTQACTSPVEQELFEIYQESIKQPPDIHYNEMNMSNYKYFGTRKLPDLDKVECAKTSGSPFHAASIAEKDILSGESQAFGDQNNTHITYASGDNFIKVMKLNEELRQTLRTENVNQRPNGGVNQISPVCQQYQRDIRTAFMGNPIQAQSNFRSNKNKNSQFASIQPQTAKNIDQFNNSSTTNQLHYKTVYNSIMSQNSGTAGSPRNWNYPMTTSSRYRKQMGGGKINFTNCNTGKDIGRQSPGFSTTSRDTGSQRSHFLKMSQHNGIREWSNILSADKDKRSATVKLVDDMTVQPSIVCDNAPHQAHPVQAAKPQYRMCSSQLNPNADTAGVNFMNPNCPPNRTFLSSNIQKATSKHQKKYRQLMQFKQDVQNQQKTLQIQRMQSQAQEIISIERNEPKILVPMVGQTIMGEIDNQLEQLQSKIKTFQFKNTAIDSSENEIGLNLDTLLAQSQSGASQSVTNNNNKNKQTVFKKRMNQHQNQANMIKIMHSELVHDQDQATPLLSPSLDVLKGSIHMK